MLRIWGRLNSINVQKVVWAADELALPHERIDAGGPFGVVDTPDYAKLNPNRLVPVIEDDGFVLWESNAIVRYLAAKAGEGTLWPRDAHLRAEADRWGDWAAMTFGPAYGPAFMTLVRTPPEKRDMAAAAASRAKAEALAPILDAALARHPWIAGATFTYGDILVAPMFHRWLGMPFADPVPRPNIAAWIARVRARPAAARVLTLPIT